MTYKMIALSAAIAAGLALPALAEHGHDGAHGMGPAGLGPMRPSFAELDADGDGSVTPEEFKAQGEARFANADTDGDGELSADELTAAAMARIEARIAARTATMVAFRDQDGNGTLSMSELSGPGMAAGMEHMFQAMDRDGNGALSEEEMAQRPMMKHGRMGPGMEGHGKGMGMGPDGHHGDGQGPARD